MVLLRRIFLWLEVKFYNLMNEEFLNQKCTHHSTFLKSNVYHSYSFVWSWTFCGLCEINTAFNPHAKFQVARFTGEYRFLIYDLTPIAVLNHCLFPHTSPTNELLNPYFSHQVVIHFFTCIGCQEKNLQFKWYSTLIKSKIYWSVVWIHP